MARGLRVNCASVYSDKKHIGHLVTLHQAAKGVWLCRNTLVPIGRGVVQPSLGPVFTLVVKVGYWLLFWHLGSPWTPTLFSDNLTSFSLVSSVAYPKKMLNRPLSS